MADRYPYGHGGVTPHIHCYNDGAHVKVAGGDRYNLVVRNRRVLQADLDVAFDRVRHDYPLAGNPVRVALLQAMRDVVRDFPPHIRDAR